MNPKWLNFRNVNGIPYYMNEEGNWVSQFNGNILTEQELTNIQSQGMMYMDDGWDAPQSVVFSVAGITKGCLHAEGVGVPARPANHFKDYNTITIECYGPGGSGGRAAGAQAGLAGGASKSGITHGMGGGGAGGYVRRDFPFNRGVAGSSGGVDYNLTTVFVEADVAKSTNTDAGILGITAHKGTVAAGTTGGVGGTGAFAATGLTGNPFTQPGLAGENGVVTRGGDGGRAAPNLDGNPAGGPGIGGSLTLVPSHSGLTPGAGGGGAMVAPGATTGMNEADGYLGVMGTTLEGRASAGLVRISYRFEKADNDYN